MNNEPAPENEAELEAFRRRWREEVQSRHKNAQEPVSPERVRPQQRRKSVPHPPPPVAGPSSVKKVEEDEDEEDVAPKAYHDLPDKEEALKLGADDSQSHERAKLFEQPRSALEHYEKAVEKENHGQLGDSLKHYRTAYKLDDGVDEHYKKKHFPKPNPSNASTTVPNPAHHSLQGQTATSQQPKTAPALPATLAQLVSDFSQLQIEPQPPPTELSPPEPCPLGEIPEEILSHILLELAIMDVASFARTAQVCKRLAYLVLTEESIWKRAALGNECGFAAMHYDYVTDIEGNALPDPEPELSEDSASSEEESQPPTLTTLPKERPTPFTPLHTLHPTLSTHTAHLLATTYSSSPRSLLRSRPRLRFNGCYISTVNYVRPGAQASNTLTWGAPVHVVTYFRYLRFFRDGTCASLQTTAEPGDVVHHLTKANLHAPPGGGLPGAVMKDSLKGRWRLSGPASLHHPEEAEGEVHIETQGVVPRYFYKMHLGLGHAGKGARNNKLVWKGFWSYNRLSDDWGEFALRNDRAFYWSRVRSYGEGWE